jgi:hypothetical protein
LPFVSNTSVQMRPVVYTDNAGIVQGGTLLSAGATMVGVTAGSILIMPLTTPPILTAGVQYWLGWHSDIAVTNHVAAQDSLIGGRYSTATTFASGAPATFPAPTTGATPTVWGIITNTTPANFYEVSQNPAQATSICIISRR